MLVNQLSRRPRYVSSPLRTPLYSAATLLGLSLMGLVHAQDMHEWETTEQRMTAAQSVQALGSDLFGDQIGLQTGTLSFSVTDVDLPGNSALPVRFTRTYEMNSTRGVTLNQMLADWSVQAPRLTGRFAPDWMVVDPDAPGVPVASNVRCSNSWLPIIPTGTEPGPAGTFELSDFSQGVQVEIPGVASGELLRTASGVTRPNPSYLWTTDGQIHFKCIALEGNPTGSGPNAGEGFEAITPDGTKYTFNRMAQRGVPGLTETQYDGDPQTFRLDVRENSLYATKVEDRFGNWVTYSYSNAWNQPGRLTKILAKDERQIDIAYLNDRVHTVTAVSPSNPAENRVWTYTYGTTAPGQPTLGRVILPDTSAWVINFATLSHSPILYPPGGQLTRDCLAIPAEPTNYDAEPIGTITHPSGATGSFKLGIRIHGRSQVTLSCANVTAPNNNTNDDNNLFGISYNAWSLLEKVITGDGLVDVAGKPVTYTWLYDYDTQNAYSFRTYPNTPPDLSFPVCNEAPDPDGEDPCRKPLCTADSTDSCAGYTKTLVTKPDGSKERYVFGTSWQYTEGKLLRVEREEFETKTPVQTETNAYDFSMSDSAYPARYGVSLRAYMDGFDSEYHRPKLETITTRDDIDFIWRVGSKCGGFRCLDYFARPTRVIKESTLDPSFSKTETQTYHDDLGHWVLGQLATTTVDDIGPEPAIVTSETTYDPTSVLPVTRTLFGRLDRSFEWHAVDGNLWRSKDALNRAYVMTDYHRGVPQSVVLPTGAAHEIKATVDDFGNVKSITNAMGAGFTTSYTYDAMNRMTSITHPAGDVVAWNQTTISFAPTTGSDLGIPLGLWARTETNGTHVKMTWYDPLWRPILERDTASDGSPSERFVRRVFDYANRETFVSYPLDTLASYTSTVEGTHTVFDGLGRMVSTEDDSELGRLRTEFAYLPGFITQQTDPGSNITTMTFQAWDGPTNEFPRQINAPEDRTTLVTRDVFGKPTRITRSGMYAGNPMSLDRDFVYDANQRLCKTVEPESGATIIEYDTVNDVDWTAIGQTFLDLTSCDRNSVVAAHKSSHDYDALHRLTAINHPAGTEDVAYSYFADGALEKATSAGSEWTYTYNKRRLLESESLQFDSRAFALDWQYNTRGQLLALTYPATPSGPLSVNFNPSARGQPRQAGSYASVGSRHANGAIQSLTYGNSLTLTTTQNERQLPETRVVGSVLDYTMTYDRNGNPDSIVDGVGGLENRIMDYDGANRLTLATAPNQFGTETFTYDPLDNIRQSQIGPVTFEFRLDTSAKNRLAQIDLNGDPYLGYESNEQGDTTRRNLIESSSIFANGFEIPASIRSSVMLASTVPIQELIYDRAHRLTGVGDIPGVANIEQYRYDAHGHRIATVRVSDGLKRYQVYSQAGQLLFTQDHRANESVDYVNLDGSLVARRTQPVSGGTPTITYVHTDVRGTPIVETNAAAAPSPDRTVLAPYGAPYNGVYRDGPGFTGHATDANTGLIYMQQRYYDPVALRFLSVDPKAADPVSFNRYWYANNNPIQNVDPDGRLAMLLPLIPPIAEGIVWVGYSVIVFFAGNEAINAYNESKGETPNSDDADSKGDDTTKIAESKDKLKAKDRRKSEQDRAKEAKFGETGEPAPESYVEWKGKQVEKTDGKGKDARRAGHDAKQKGEPDRSKETIDDDYQ